MISETDIWDGEELLFARRAAVNDLIHRVRKAAGIHRSTRRATAPIKFRQGVRTLLRLEECLLINRRHIRWVRDCLCVNFPPFLLSYFPLQLLQCMIVLARQCNLCSCCYPTCARASHTAE
jgi:hypothetical protein